MTDHTAVPLIEDLRPGRYRLDPAQSRVHYTGKAMFGLGTVHATFAVQEGELRIGEQVAASEVSVIVAAGFTSDNARRDEHVRGASLLDVERYPTITFVSDAVQPTSDGWLVRGTVTAHGHAAPVDMRIDRATREGDGIRFHGRAEQLDRTEFGITGSRGMIGRYLDLEIDAFGSAAGAESDDD